MKMKGWQRRIAAAIPVAAFAFLLTGCSDDMGVLDPKGIVAKQQLDLIVITSILCAIILVPVLIMTFWFAWKYRSRKASNAEYKPNWSHSGKIETVMWGVPIAIILILAILTVQYSHKLEPSKALAAEADVKKITIEVTSLDWKWLFTYPEQGIATVNYVEFPKDVPVEFKITADGPMNSFWIPQLGGQLYAMSGMAMELNLMADEEGEFQGKGANFTGEHFGKMGFTAKATSQEEFDDWVADVKAKSGALTQQGYDELAEPGAFENTASYSSFPDGLFDRIVNKYGSSHHHGASSSESGDSAKESADKATKTEDMDMTMNMDMTDKSSGVTDASELAQHQD